MRSLLDLSFSLNILAAATVALWAPVLLVFLVWVTLSVVNSLKGIHRELARANETHAHAPAAPLRAERGEGDAVRYETRTGSLGRL